MFTTLKNAWKVTEIRTKMLFTLLIVLIYRLGAQIPVPYIDSDQLSNMSQSIQGTGFAWMNLLSGNAFSQATLFALSVSPYITASIVIELLAVAIPALQRLSESGEEGKKKLTAITRYTTVVLSLVTAFGYMKMMGSYGMLVSNITWFGKMVAIAAYCAGAAIIMWLAEKINDHGIGNGISMILFANILSRVPSLLGSVWNMAFKNAVGFSTLFNGFSLSGLILAIFSLAITFGIIVLMVWFTESERRIPIQYAKRVVGRKMYGGQNSNLPLKLNMSGVMPVIFASSIVTVPATIATFVPDSGYAKFVEKWFGYNTWIYLLIYLVLIVAFAYFYILIQFNPVEVANNIQRQGGAIPGIRSGRPTVQYITKILNRVTLIGAIFLCFVAGLPMLVNIINHTIDTNSTTFAGIAFGGNSLLIVVGVALEVMHDLEAQLAMRSYGKAATKGIFG